MAPHVSANFAVRAALPDDEDTSLSPTIVAGIIVAAVIGVGLATWLGIRWYRKRANATRVQPTSAFVTFNNQGSEDDVQEKSAFPSAFSRNQINSTVIMPERAVLRPGASRDEILEHYAAEGKLPRPFAPLPAGSPTFKGEMDFVPPPSPSRPMSTASWATPIFPLAGGENRMSMQSMASSVASSVAGQKKVRQIFDPVLPDELVVSVGETMTLVQQHDDGWCIVGRDSVFNPGEVELGAIPAWCFLKPVKGLRAERPMRVSSLGVTVNLDPPPGFGQRDNVMSWSNF